MTEHPHEDLAIWSVMHTILFVLTNLELGEVLAESMGREGYTSVSVTSVDEVSPQLMTQIIDVVVLDGLSSASAVSDCAKLRLTKPAPILVLSVAGMARQWAGVADDVLVRPFAIQDLVSRTNALLRRRASPRQAVFSWSDISLNVDSHRVTVGSRTVDLGLMEFRLLHLLLTEPHRIWSRSEILERLWSSDRDERMVDVVVKRLRAALNREQRTNAIRTVRGAGYGLV